MIVSTSKCVENTHNVDVQYESNYGYEKQRVAKLTCSCGWMRVVHELREHRAIRQHHWIVLNSTSESVLR